MGAGASATWETDLEGAPAEEVKKQFEALSEEDRAKLTEEQLNKIKARCRKRIVFGNWKSNPAGLSTVTELCTAFAACEFDTAKLEVGILPAYVHGGAVAALLSNSKIQVGAQNISKNAAGAFTGESSAGMVADAGYGWALVGHSERRSLYGETDDDCVAKIQKAQDAGLRVIYAIGESKAERDEGVTDQVNQRMLEKVLPIVQDWDKFVIAYEPVWAIGTGVVATPEQAQETQANIRKYVREKSGDVAADKVRIQYGGSASPDNCEALIALPDIDGFLVGGASLKPTFTKMIEALSK